MTCGFDNGDDETTSKLIAPNSCVRFGLALEAPIIVKLVRVIDKVSLYVPASIFITIGILSLIALATDKA